MSGVIDKHGVQWEHCTICSSWVRLEELGFLPPRTILKYPHGADVCMLCANDNQGLIRHVQPGKSWQLKVQTA
jgi:hypothetical protein